MSLPEVVFLVMSAVAIASAVLAVGSRQLVHAALWLVVTLGAVAGCFVLMTAELLAWVQVLVYVGAVVVLVVFALMLTRSPTGSRSAEVTANRPVGGGARTAGRRRARRHRGGRLPRRTHHRRAAGHRGVDRRRAVPPTGCWASRC